MPITDLTGTTWRINEVPVVSTYFQYTVFFTANNNDYVGFVGIPTSPGNYMITYGTQTGSSNPDALAYNTSTGGWNTDGGADYRTIVISEDQHGQTGVTNPTLIAWLEANAVQVTYPVTISYDGDTIATMEESGTKTLQTAGKYCDGDIEVKYTEPTPSLQNKTVSPATTSQSVTADSGYDGLGTVTVNAMPSGAAGTPTATKGTVSNHSVSVTPSVTNTPGYITGGTKTGTAVTVSASELVSGTLSITSSGTTDVTNYASASVAAGSAKTPTTYISAYPQISIDYTDGSIEATVAAAESVTPTVTAGYVSSGTAGTINVDGTQSELLPTKSAQTYTPTTTNQTIAQYQWLTGSQTIKGDANLVAGNIKKDVSIFNVTGTYEGGGNDTAPSLIMRQSGTYTYSVSYVGPYAFAGYYMRSITLTFPQCTNVHAYAFAHWSYMSTGSRLVSLPQCTSIGSNAFRDFFLYPKSTVASVYAPMCSSMGGYAFYNCYGMPVASFPTCSTIASFAFALSSSTGARLSVLSFPQCIRIEHGAFLNQAALTEASFPECEFVYVSAFTGCAHMVNANFPKCVGFYPSATADTGVFNNCTSLTTISFPLLKDIKCRLAFAGTHIVSAYLPELLSAVSGIFAGCTHLVSVNLPKASTLYGSTASSQGPFNGCAALTDVSIPLLNTVGNYGFGGCTALSQIQLPSVSIIHDYAFQSCTALVSVSFPICVSISASAFRSCTSLSDVYLPLCASIGSYTFHNCTALQTISLPALQRIPNSTAFRGCTRLISLYLLGSSVVTLSNSAAFSSTPIGGYSTVAGQYGSIYVPASLLASYQAATGWRSLSARLVGV